MAGYCEYSDEPAGSGATELVSYTFFIEMQPTFVHIHSYCQIHGHKKRIGQSLEARGQRVDNLCNTECTRCRTVGKLRFLVKYSNVRLQENMCNFVKQSPINSIHAKLVKKSHTFYGIELFITCLRAHHWSL
jgi:hypothetical protein